MSAVLQKKLPLICALNPWKARAIIPKVLLQRKSRSILKSEDQFAQPLLLQLSLPSDRKDKNNRKCNNILLLELFTLSYCLRVGSNSTSPLLKISKIPPFDVVQAKVVIFLLQYPSKKNPELIRKNIFVSLPRTKILCYSAHKHCNRNIRYATPHIVDWMRVLI